MLRKILPDHRLLRRRGLPAMLLCAAVLMQAASPAGAATGSLNDELGRMLKAIPTQRINSEPRKKALYALELISQDRLKEGSQAMNAALQLDPSNSYLQFFNALSYHMMGQRGDRQMLALAEQGYVLAAQFDRSNWIAHYFLGLLHFEQRNFPAARRELAEVLLFREDDEEVLFRLVAASYYAGDPVTAAACLERLRKLAPADPQILRLSAIISAAIGDAVQANVWLKQYQALAPAGAELDKTRDRVRHWNTLHQNNPPVTAGAGLALKSDDILTQPSVDKPKMVRVQASPIQNQFNSAGMNRLQQMQGNQPQQLQGSQQQAIRNFQGNGQGNRPVTAQDSGDEEMNQGGQLNNGGGMQQGMRGGYGDDMGGGFGGGMGMPVNDCSGSQSQGSDFGGSGFGGSGFGGGGFGGGGFGGGMNGGGSFNGGSGFGGGDGFGGSSFGSGGKSTPPPNAKRMVLVDVVIMLTEDSLNSRYGLNMLSALTLQFGGANLPGFSKTYASTTDADGSKASTILTRAINLPALNYSLNIVNSNTNLNEVLARPTLAALEGVKSEFFSGTTLNAAVVSTGNTGGGSVQIEKEIGVKLCIFPTFMEDNKIRLSVNAQRTFLKPPSQDVAFTYKVEVSKVMVNAKVVMKFGETLVLGGLSEKETSNTRDGVPLLQDVPVLQYLFARRDKSDFQRSVLMLITPRTPQYAYRSDDSNRAEAKENSEPDSIYELRARYGDWFKPYPNLASVFNHMNQSSIYREFRTGDVTLEKWDKQRTTMERLQQAIDFLLF